MRFSRKAKIGAAAVIASMGLGVAGFAYWTTTGTGSGSATTGTNTALTITQVGDITALVPGGTPQAVDFMINNSAATPQYVTSVTVAIASVTTGAGPGPACAIADYDLVQPTATYGDLTSGDHTYSPSGATLALKNTPLNQDNCKNQSVTLSFTAA